MRVLNVGSGGDIEEYLRSKFSFVKSIDIDDKREPDQIIDICNKKELEQLTFKPNLICIFEVLDILKILFMDKGGYDFHLHLFFTYMMNHTIFIDLLNMDHLFKDFAEVEILSRNGWFETILVLFVRLRLEKSLVGKNNWECFYIVLLSINPSYVASSKNYYIR